MVSQFVAAGKDCRGVRQAIEVGWMVALDRIEEFFGRIQPLRLMMLGGLRGPFDPADAASLFERVAADIAASFPEAAAEIARLREAFRGVPATKDADRRLSKARGLVDELNGKLAAIESDLVKLRGPSRTRLSVRNYAGWIATAVAFCVILVARLAYDPVFIGWFIFPFHGQRLADLAQIREALVKYHMDHGNFPVSTDDGSNWNGIGWSGDPNQWIPALAPTYLATIPRDPRQDENPYNQYIYKSNGEEYKLLALVPEDCQYTIKHYPKLSDPPRNVYNQCYAYGYWTPGADLW